MHRVNRSFLCACVSFSLAVAVLLASATPAAAQKKKKKNQPASDSTPIIPLSDEQQIDYMISEMLGAWQIGDTDRMHKYYADDASFVSGIWAPPVIGWASYLPLYQKQHARAQQIRLDRSNTYIKVAGITAWTCYQWEFTGIVDGQPEGARGQTTLVLQKRDNKWLIVHNHTSIVQMSPPPGGATSAPASVPQPSSQPQH
jgi:ketosteroid isomerase-like protein